jgi:hypothetical protein
VGLSWVISWVSGAYVIDFIRLGLGFRAFFLFFPKPGGGHGSEAEVLRKAQAHGGLGSAGRRGGQEIGALCDGMTTRFSFPMAGRDSPR